MAEGFLKRFMTQARNLPVTRSMVQSDGLSSGYERQTEPMRFEAASSSTVGFDEVSFHHLVGRSRAETPCAGDPSENITINTTNHAGGLSNSPVPRPESQKTKPVFHADMDGSLEGGPQKPIPGEPLDETTPHNKAASRLYREKPSARSENCQELSHQAQRDIGSISNPLESKNPQPRDVPSLISRGELNPERSVIDAPQGRTVQSVATRTAKQNPGGFQAHLVEAGKPRSENQPRLNTNLNEPHGAERAAVRPDPGGLIPKPHFLSEDLPQSGGSQARGTVIARNPSARPGQSKPNVSNSNDLISTHTKPHEFEPHPSKPRPEKMEPTPHRLHIDQIEVVLEAPPKEPRSTMGALNAQLGWFVSGRYLRRL